MLPDFWCHFLHLTYYTYGNQTQFEVKARLAQLHQKGSEVIVSPSGVALIICVKYAISTEQ